MNQGKLKMMVTHDRHFLHMADHIIILDKVRIPVAFFVLIGVVEKSYTYIYIYIYLFHKSSDISIFCRVKWHVLEHMRNYSCQHFHQI